MKPRKFVIVSDIHGIEQDERATKAALNFTKEFQPDIRVIAGDLWDFAAIRQGASPEERAISMAEDYEAGANFAKAFFVPKALNVLELGNHDHRAWELAGSNDAVRADLGQRMVEDINGLTRKLNAKLLPYDSRHGVFELGHLRVVHGYHTGASACAAHSRIYGNVVFGHVHSIESFQTPGLKQQEARAIGCLCKLDMEYANRKTAKLRWSHGFVYGWVFEDGTYQINQVRGVEGRFFAPVGLKEF